MIIAIESASTDPSLALASVEGVVFASDGWEGEGRQASELLPRLLELLAQAGRELPEHVLRASLRSHRDDLLVLTNGTHDLLGPLSWP